MTPREKYPSMTDAEIIDELGTRDLDPLYYEAHTRLSLLRSLLSKYIQHVAECEGATFIVGYRNVSDVEFTDKEWATLEEIGADL